MRKDVQDTCSWSVSLVVFEELFFDGICAQSLQRVIGGEVLRPSSEMSAGELSMRLVCLPRFFEHVSIRERGYACRETRYAEVASDFERGDA